MFNMFPYLNLHKINLNFIIQTVETCKTIVDGANDRIQQALDNAATALTAAQEALNTATDARYRVNLMDGRVTTLETDQTTMAADMERLAGRVSNLALDVEGKVDNGNDTITGAEHQLTVEGENSGDMTTMTGTAFLAQSLFAGSVPVGWTAARDSSLDDDTNIRVFQRSGAAVRITNVLRGVNDNDAVNMWQLNSRTDPLIIDVALLTGGNCTVLEPFDNITDAIYKGRNIFARITSSPDDKYTYHIFPVTLFRDSGVASGRSIMFHGFYASQYYPTCIIRGYAPNTWNWVERTT